MTNWRELCAELLQAVDDLPWQYDWKGEPVGPLAEIDEGPFERARALLAQPEPEVAEPSDEELLDLMPRQLREDLATVSRMAVYGAGSGVTPDILRVILNTGALDFARAILQHYATPHPSPVPVPVAERPWEREGWCNAEGKCWFLREICGDLAWELEDPSSTITFGRISCLPHNALPVPGAEVLATELRQEGRA